MLQCFLIIIIIILLPYYFASRTCGWNFFFELFAFDIMLITWIHVSQVPQVQCFHLNVMWPMRKYFLNAITFFMFRMEKCLLSIWTLTDFFRLHVELMTVMSRTQAHVHRLFSIFDSYTNATNAGEWPANWCLIWTVFADLCIFNKRIRMEWTYAEQKIQCAHDFINIVECNATQRNESIDFIFTTWRC